MGFERGLQTFRNVDTRIGRATAVGTGGLAALALLASGCGGGGTTTVIERAPAGGNVPAQSGGGHEHANAQLTFDYLGGGSKTIEVYPGVADTPADKQYDGTYKNGETVGAVCKTEGRELHSDPSVGETPRHSDEWAELAVPAGQEPQYASFVYTDNPHQLMIELPNC